MWLIWWQYSYICCTHIVNVYPTTIDRHIQTLFCMLVFPPRLQHEAVSVALIVRNKIELTRQNAGISYSILKADESGCTRPAKKWLTSSQFNTQCSFPMVSRIQNRYTRISYGIFLQYLRACDLSIFKQTNLPSSFQKYFPNHYLHRLLDSEFEVRFKVPDSVLKVPINGWAKKERRLRFAN